MSKDKYILNNEIAADVINTVSSYVGGYDTFIRKELDGKRKSKEEVTVSKESIQILANTISREKSWDFDDQRRDGKITDTPTHRMIYNNPELLSKLVAEVIDHIHISDNKDISNYKTAYEKGQNILKEAETHSRIDQSGYRKMLTKAIYNDIISDGNTKNNMLDALENTINKENGHSYKMEKARSRSSSIGNSSFEFSSKSKIFSTLAQSALSNSISKKNESSKSTSFSASSDKITPPDEEKKSLSTDRKSTSSSGSEKENKKFQNLEKERLLKTKKILVKKDDNK